MSGCVRDIRTKNYQNLIIGFQVTAKNVGDVFFGTQCSSLQYVISLQFDTTLLQSSRASLYLESLSEADDKT